MYHHNRKALAQASMKLAAIIIVLSLLASSSWQALSASEQESSSTYIEPALVQSEQSELAVIVTADSSDTAKTAVQAIGGQITSDLWLINAVGAVINAEALPQLAAYPGVTSIVNNKGVEPASVPPAGWVTDIRVKKGIYDLNDNLAAPATFLADGGIFAVTENGNVLIVNKDGSERSRFSLAKNTGPYLTSPVQGANGLVFVVDANKQLQAFDANGNSVWTFGLSGNVHFVHGIALGAGDVVYVLDDGRFLHAINGSNGQELWNIKLRGDKPGMPVATPVVGADGTIYVATAGVGSTPQGHLFAVQSDGTQKWLFQAALGHGFNYGPVLSGSKVFITSEQTVYAVNMADGTQHYAYSAGAVITAQPTAAADGRLYLVTQNNLIGLDANGHQLFTPFNAPSAPNANSTAGSFQTSPVLSPDETTVYVSTAGRVYIPADKEYESQPLIALNATTGSVLWRHSLGDGALTTSPVVLNDGHILLTNEAGKLHNIQPDGVTYYQHDYNYLPSAENAITQAVSVDSNKNVAVRLIPDTTNPAVTQLAYLGEPRSAWDPSIPYVAPAPAGKEWKIAISTAVDVGADVVYNSNIRGRNVAIAVIDSGVYFDPSIRNFDTGLGPQVEKHFIGQADFTGTGQCTNGGTQNSGYCFTTYVNSNDGFGHGTHVAGTIWNNFRDYYTGTTVGVAPSAEILSVRVLDDNGQGTYEDVIEGIQYVVSQPFANIKPASQAATIRIINLSLSAQATTPYFVDPINRAVEAAWESGIVVLAAAGNSGPGAQTITVPGNDPYVITVGAIDSNKTPGYWADDFIPEWSGAGPTLDGFVKPDVLAPGGNVISFMYNDGNTDPATSHSSKLVLEHPDYSVTTSFFRMNGTSMATAVASGVTALMLEQNPSLTPDQVKFRLTATARFATTNNNQLGYSPLKQGAGRIWAPDAVFSTDIPLESANQGMDITTDLAHGWILKDSNGNPIYDDQGNLQLDNAELACHYQGPVQRVLSDDGQVYLYYIADPNENNIIALGAARAADMTWITPEVLALENPTFFNNNMSWENGYTWAGGYGWLGGVGYGWLGGVNMNTANVASTSWVDDHASSPTAVSLQSLHAEGQNSVSPTLLIAILVLVLLVSLSYIHFNRAQ
jgi:outer membrane protein assembly factor BamB